MSICHVMTDFWTHVLMSDTPVNVCCYHIDVVCLVVVVRELVAVTLILIYWWLIADKCHVNRECWKNS